jgi:hypothetical protein
MSASTSTSCGADHFARRGGKNITLNGTARGPDTASIEARPWVDDSKFKEI